MKRRKKALIWLAAVATASILIFPKEVCEAVKFFRKELERERKELEKKP
jgi:hypothetical protein